MTVGTKGQLPAAAAPGWAMGRLRKIGRACRWPAVGMALILGLARLNRFPDGAVFANGDVIQYFDRDFVSRNFPYIWSNALGEGLFSPLYMYYPFYAGAFAVSDTLGLTPSQEPMLFMVFFWGGSYLSFLAALRMVSDAQLRPRGLEANLCALLYACNPYTFYAFYFIWGYSAFLSIYVFVPPILVATLEYLGEKSAPRRARLLAVLFFAHLGATLSYANLPFFVALNLLLGGLALTIRLLNPKRENLVPFAWRLAAYFAIELAANAWAVLPQLPHLLFEIRALDSAIFDYANWILWQRLSFWEVFTLSPDARSYSLRHPLAMALSFVVFAAALWAYVSRRGSAEHTRSALALAVLAAAVLLLETKGKGIAPDALAVWAYSNPVVGALRSNGKAIVFLPCILLLLLTLTPQDPRGGRRRKLVGLALAANLIASYPMFAGQLQTKEASAISPGKDCRTSEFCGLVRIPREYVEAAAAIRGDGLSGKILSLPYSVVNSPGWSNHPPWKHVGADPTVQLFSLPVVQANAYGAFGYPYAQKWVDGELGPPEVILDVAGDLGATYLLFHQDVKPAFIYPAKSYLAQMEKVGHLARIYDSPVVTVYRVALEFRRPLATLHLGDRPADPPLPLQAVKINPAKYVVLVPEGAAATLVLRESHSALWTVHARRAASARRPDESPWWETFTLDTVAGASNVRFAEYANSWRLDTKALCDNFGCTREGRSGERVATLVLEYRPQRYVHLLLLGAALAAVAGCMVLILLHLGRDRPGQAQG